MRMKDVGQELAVVSRFVEQYMSNVHLIDPKVGLDLLKRAGDVFVQHGEERKECETCVTELLQLSRAFQLITVQNKELQDQDNYYSDFNASVAALKRVAATVRLHFLMMDLEALVNDQ